MILSSGSGEESLSLGVWGEGSGGDWDDEGCEMEVEDCGGEFAGGGGGGGEEDDFEFVYAGCTEVVVVRLLVGDVGRRRASWLVDLRRRIREVLWMSARRVVRKGGVVGPRRRRVDITRGVVTSAWKLDVGADRSERLTGRRDKRSLVRPVRMVSPVVRRRRTRMAIVVAWSLLM